VIVDNPKSVMGLTMNCQITWLMAPANGPLCLLAGAVFCHSILAEEAECMTYFAVILGGLMGGTLRYLVSISIPTFDSFPLGTLCINLGGSLLLGMFYGMAAARQVRPWVRVGVGAGLIGAFTTFSTFCMEFSKLASINFALMLLYGLSSVVGGPLLAYIGDRLVVMFSPQTASEQRELSV
jgi:fluoride exporter